MRSDILCSRHVHHCLGTDDMSYKPLISIDGKEPQALEHDTDTVNPPNVANANIPPSAVRVFKVSNLSPLVHHTVKITVTELVRSVKEDKPAEFTLLGFRYSPSFESLAEGEQMLAALNLGSTSSSTDPPQITGSGQPLASPPRTK